jgi:hypothetical protein
MKKTTNKKLTISRDTIQTLQGRQLGQVMGGATQDVCHKTDGTGVGCCVTTNSGAAQTCG